MADIGGTCGHVHTITLFQLVCIGNGNVVAVLLRPTRFCVALPPLP